MFSYVPSLYVLYVGEVAVHLHSLRFGIWCSIMVMGVPGLCSGDL